MTQAQISAIIEASERSADWVIAQAEANYRQALASGTPEHQARAEYDRRREAAERNVAWAYSLTV